MRYFTTMSEVDCDLFEINEADFTRLMTLFVFESEKFYELAK